MPSNDEISCKICEETITPGERLFAVRWEGGSFHALCLKCTIAISETVVKEKGRLKGKEGYFTLYSTAPGGNEPIVNHVKFAVSLQDAAQCLPGIAAIFGLP